MQTGQNLLLCYPHIWLTVRVYVYSVLGLLSYDVPTTYSFDMGSVTDTCTVPIAFVEVILKLCSWFLQASPCFIGRRKNKKKEDVDSGSAIRATPKASFQSCGSGFNESGSEYGFRSSILSESGSGSSPDPEF
jgi:hypothetical protein